MQPGIALNRSAWLAAIDPALVEAMAGLTPPTPQAETVDALTARLAAELTAYQDAHYAARFTALVADATPRT